MRSLRGQLLVAGPALLDPNFRRTVVLLGEHGEDGAMGLVLNRVSDVTVADAVPPIADLVGDGELVHVGGPVQPQAVVVLADFVEPHRAGALVLDTIGFLPGDVDDETDLGELRTVRVYAGYAGWGPGQLEDELDEQSWVVLRRGRRTSSRPRPTPSGRRCSAGTAARSASSRSSPRTRTSTDVP